MICFQVVLFGLKQHLLLRERWKLKKEVEVIYRFSTSFSFSLKMFLSSPRVDSIFSRENWFSPSEDLSLATQEFSSVTVLSSRVHCFRRMSTFFTHSSLTALTLAYLSLRAATSASASACVVNLLGGTIGGIQNLGVGKAGLVEGGHLLVKGLDLVEVRGLRQTLSSGLLSTSQPGRVLLDSGPVLGPELDIVGVLVALNLGVSSQLGDVVSDPVQLILEGLGMGINSGSLRKKSKLSSSTSLEDLKLDGNVLLQIHGPGHTILREHSTGGFLDVLQLSGGSVLPSVNPMQGVVKVDEGSAEVLNNGNSVLEAGDNLELGVNSLDLLVKNLLLVLGKGDGHAGEVVVDGLEESADGVVALVVQLLPLLQVGEGILKVVPLLHLLDLLLGNLELRGN